MAFDRLIPAPMRVTRSLLSAVLGMLGASGCFVEGGHDDGHVVRDTAYYTAISSDETLSTELGSGAGLFVEYARGGVWRLWTSCDTALTGHGCAFQIDVASFGRIDAVDGIELEPYDHVDVFKDGTLSFYAETDYDSDAIEIFAAPGALLEVAVALDGVVDPSYVVWVGHGSVNEGAPSSPVVFQPDAP